MTCFVAVVAAVGCRIGEALALDVTDFDPTVGTLTITKTYSRHYGIGPPKSKYSTRTIRVPPAALPAILAAIRKRTAGLLFPSARGYRRDEMSPREAWVKVLARVGLSYRNLHQLRHSVATALISAGVPLGDVAACLGDTVQTVVSTYLHPAGTDPSLAMERLLGGRKVGTETRTATKTLKSRAISA